MGLGVLTVRKFIREALVTATPITIGSDSLAEFKKRLQSVLEKTEEMRFQWQERTNYPRAGDRCLCDISVKDPRYDHYWYGQGGFTLILDAQNALHLYYDGKRYAV